MQHTDHPDGILDSEGHLARAYGALGTTLVLIRPDGYVAVISDAGDVSAISPTSLRLSVAAGPNTLRVVAKPLDRYGQQSLQSMGGLLNECLRGPAPRILQV